MAAPQQAAQPNGPNGYLAVKPTPETAARIAVRLAELGIKDAIPADELHVTLYYAPSGLPDSILGTVDTKRIHLTFANGEPHLLGDDGSALVLPLDAPSLHQRHEQIKDFTGVAYSYPNYLPHLSLKYGPTEDDLAKAQADTHLVRMVIDLTGEYCEDLTG